MRPADKTSPTDFIAIGLIIVALVWAVAFKGCEQKEIEREREHRATNVPRSGVGSEASPGDPPRQPLGEAMEQSRDLQSSEVLHPGADTRSFSSEALALERLRELGHFDEVMQPSAEGLYLRTSGIWNQPDFLNLTEAEARKLLPLDDWLPAVGAPDNLAVWVGGLPTAEDCELALRHPIVYGALAHVCELEIDAQRLALITPEKRSAGWQSAVGLADRNYRSAERDLMSELDKVSTYKNWSLMWRLYQQWEK